MERSATNATRTLLVVALLGLGPFYFLVDTSFENRQAVRIENETMAVFEKIDGQLHVYRETIRSVESLKIIQQAPKADDEKKSIQLALDTLRSFIDAASLFVLNDRGILVEGSGKVTIGADFRFRTYFRKAMEGQTYIHPALGVHHRTLRMFFSAPVALRPDGTPSGVVAFSVEMPKIGTLLASGFPRNVYGLITENGVVFASTAEELTYKAVLPISQEDLRTLADTKQFSEKTVEPAEFTITHPTVSFSGKDYTVHRKKFPTSNMELFCLIERNKPSEFAFYAGASVAYAILFFLLIRLSVANDRRVRAEREIVQRNTELEASNRHLQQEIGQRMAAEAALAQTNRRLEALSATDPLTGLANRRHFDETLAREYARHASSGADLSLIMLDIDYFKAYNDRYGHVKGDECLQRIGAVLAAQMLRPENLAARYGGEEFVCLLPETPRADAERIAETIRRAIRDLGIEHEGSSRGAVVTASLGVVTARCVGGGYPETVVAEADALLYRAKSEGRDRVAARDPRGDRG